VSIDYHSLLLRLRVYTLARVLLQLLHCPGIEPQQVRKFRQIDTFGTAWLFVTPKDAVCKHIESAPMGVIGHSGHDLREWTWLHQLLLDDAVHTRDASLIEDCLSLLIAHGSVGMRRGYREADELERLIADVG